jgi:hypothetical protein
VSQRLAYEAKAGEVVWLALDLLILLYVGVITGEVEITEGSKCSGHHLLELLLLLVPDTVLLIIALVVVIPFGIVVLVGGVEFLPLGIVGNEVSGVAALETAPR